jgi:hypothetical protein
MSEFTTQLTSITHRASEKLPRRKNAKTLGRRLLHIIVYDKGCRAGGLLMLDDLDTTDIGDWKMSDYKAACAYGVSQGWLTVENDILTLTTAGLAAA